VARLAGSVVPDALADLLNGVDLHSKVGLTVELLTVGDEGWPNVALLSAGEVVVVGPSQVRIALWPDSQTSRNLAAREQCTLTLVQGGAAHYLRCRAASGGPLELSTGHRLARFDLTVSQYLVDEVAYARLESGAVFSLAQPDQTLEMWRLTVDALRA
jgi:flavin reductase (DIM6/NTAB) family NADH-FMN oxidoreductase RutF